MNIGIVGLSHQGLVYMSFLSKFNFKIIGIDTNKNLIKELKENFVSADTLAEPFIQKTLRTNKKKITFTDNFKEITKCNLLLITEDVKILSDGSKNESKVYYLIKTALKNVKNNSNLIILSQVSVGFANKIKKITNVKKKINILNSPDILTIGQALKDLIAKKTYIVGSSNSNFIKNKNIKNFFSRIKKKVIYTNLESVEVAKEAVQLKLGLDVTFVNLLDDFCKYNKAITHDVIDYMKLDIRFSKKGYWRPGLGFGGGHIERGLKTFDKNLNTNYKNLIEQIITFNEKRMDYFSNSMMSYLDKIKNLKLGILGLSYKKNSESVFRSYATRFIQKIKKQKNPIYAYDPFAEFTKNFEKKYSIKQVSQIKTVLKNSNVLMFMCDWDEFKRIKLINFKQSNIKIIIDPFSIFRKNKDSFIKKGIKYLQL